MNIQPFTGYAIAGSGVVILILLWLSARLEAGRCRRDMGVIKASTESAMREISVKVEALSVRAESEPLVEKYPAPQQSINLTRRARALHMRRRGEAPHTIAAALGISQGEVDLLFKLDGLFQKPVDQAYES